MTPVKTTSPLNMTSGMEFNQTNNGPLSVMGAKPGAWVFSDRLVVRRAMPLPGTSSARGPASKAGRRQRDRQAPRSNGVSAGKSLLGFPVVRDGDIRRPGRHLEWRLLLVGPPPSFLKRRRDYAGRVLGTGYEIGELEVPEISGERRQT